MGRSSTWKNKPTSSLPVPVLFKPVLREVGRAIDAAEPVSFEREVTDCDGTVLALSISIAVLQVVAVEPAKVESAIAIASTIAIEPELLELNTPEQAIAIEPELLELNTPEQSIAIEPVSEPDGDNPSINLPGVASTDSEPSKSKSVLDPVADIEAPIETTVTIPTVIPNKEINAIAQTHPAPPDPYAEPPPIALTKTPFVDQLYQAWMFEIGEASKPKPVLLEEIYENHFSSISGVTFIRKVEQSINLPGSGIKIHINLGATETYKLKNGLTLEGISFSHPPEQKGESNANSSTAHAQVLATIALSVIGTCVVASSVLAFIPGMNGIQHTIPSKYK